MMATAEGPLITDLTITLMIFAWLRAMLVQNGGKESSIWLTVFCSTEAVEAKIVIS